MVHRFFAPAKSALGIIAFHARAALWAISFQWSPFHSRRASVLSRSIQILERP